MAAKTALGLLAAIVCLVLTVVACAPRSKQIEGDIGRRVQEGISQGAESFDHATFDGILRRYAKASEHRFDYEGLKKKQADLDAYLRQIARQDVSRLSRDSLLAFFINAYNAFTIETILNSMTNENPHGVAGIRDIPQVFDARTHIVGGESLSLNNIEHNILRPYFKDPRIHFAVNCASISCPPLADRAYEGKMIDAQLDAAARRTIQSADYVRIENGRLLVTRILDWYGSDFVTPGYHGAADSVADYIRRYAVGEVRQFIRSHPKNVPIEFMPYNWSLNSTQDATAGIRRSILETSGHRDPSMMLPPSAH